MRKASIFIGILMLCQIAWGLEVPKLNGRINDHVGILDKQATEHLDTKLQAFEDSTSNQIALLIIPTLDGEVLEEYALKVFESWKLGEEKKDNGVLILLVIQDRKSKIEVGYGLEGVLTDAKSNEITAQIFPNYFAQGKYFEGIDTGLTKITQIIGNEYSQNKGKIFGLKPLIWFLILIVYFAVFTIIGFAIGEPLLALWLALRILTAVASGGKGGFSGSGGSSGGGGSPGSW